MAENGAVNKADLDKVVEEIKSAIIAVSSTAVFSLLATQIPFFNLPVIKQLTQLTIKWVIGQAVWYTELGAYKIYTDQYTEEQAKKFKEATDKRVVAKTKAEKELADKEIIDAARRFIKLGA